MQRFVWNESYSIGHELVDAQHRQLFEIINRLAIYDQASTNLELISQILSQLTEYASFHFETEESYLEKIACANLVSHKQEHRQFRIKVMELCKAALENKDVTVEEIFNYLSDWLVNHILDTDQQCFSTVQKPSLPIVSNPES